MTLSNASQPFLERLREVSAQRRRLTLWLNGVLIACSTAMCGFLAILFYRPTVTYYVMVACFGVTWVYLSREIMAVWLKLRALEQDAEATLAVLARADADADAAAAALAQTPGGFEMCICPTCYGTHLANTESVGANYELMAAEQDDG